MRLKRVNTINIPLNLFYRPINLHFGPSAFIQYLSYHDLRFFTVTVTYLVASQNASYFPHQLHYKLMVGTNHHDYIYIYPHMHMNAIFSFSVFAQINLSKCLDPLSQTSMKTMIFGPTVFIQFLFAHSPTSIANKSHTHNMSYIEKTFIP